MFLPLARISRSDLQKTLRALGTAILNGSVKGSYKSLFIIFLRLIVARLFESSRRSPNPNFVAVTCGYSRAQKEASGCRICSGSSGSQIRGLCRAVRLIRGIIRGRRRLIEVLRRRMQMVVMGRGRRRRRGLYKAFEGRFM